MSTDAQKVAAKGLDASSEAELLRLVARAIRNTREVDVDEDQAERIAWNVYNAILAAKFSIR